MYESLAEADYKSKSGLSLEFVDEEIERAYIDDIASDNAQTVANCSWFFWLFWLSGILSFCLSVDDWSWDSVGQDLLRGALSILAVNPFRFVPNRYIEYMWCVVEFCFLSCVLFSNQYRLERLSVARLPKNYRHLVWRKCDGDLAVHARDMLHVCLVQFLKSSGAVGCTTGCEHRCCQWQEE